MCQLQHLLAHTAWHQLQGALLAALQNTPAWFWIWHNDIRLQGMQRNAQNIQQSMSSGGTKSGSCSMVQTSSKLPMNSLQEVSKAPAKVDMLKMDSSNAPQNLLTHLRPDAS